jgi:LysM repeat protein
MKSVRFIYAIFALSFSSILTAYAYHTPEIKMDSVGKEVVNGQVFILHKVNPGQTLFAVTRQYNITIHDLRASNPGMADQVKVGQIIKVPYKKAVVSTPAPAEKPTSPPVAQAPAAVVDTAPKPSQASSGASTKHIVAEGETLYRVAVKYGVLMADVRKWNNLSSDNVVIGQELIVSEGASEIKAAAPEPKKVVSVPTTTEAEKKPVAVAEKVVKPEENVPVKPVSGKQMSESGLAEIIDTGESSNKFLALHRSAPIGTLVQVTNEFNSESIWVKVIGRIPDTSVNEEILIKLSSRAFEKVSPNTRRFRAQINYIASK